MSKFTISEALVLINNKRGAGKSKNTALTLKIDFNGGVYETRQFLSYIDMMLKVSPCFLSVTINSVQDEVTTELEENPDWGASLND